jgi:hypothetical protein
MYEKPKPESTCRVVLEDGNPCNYDRFLFAICHAWYAMESRPASMSMRQIFVDGLAEGRAIWGQACAVKVKEEARKEKEPKMFTTEWWRRRR